MGGQWAVFSLCILHVFKCNLPANLYRSRGRGQGRVKVGSGGGAPIARPGAAPDSTAEGGGRAGATSSARPAGRPDQSPRPLPDYERVLIQLPPQSDRGDRGGPG